MTYSIIRTNRETGKTVETIVASGLDWKTADQQRNSLDQIESAKPSHSSWIGNLHIVRLEEGK